MWFRKKEKNILNFKYCYEKHRAYDHFTKYKNLKNLDYIKNKYYNNKYHNELFILTNFNNKIYPMLDIDNSDKYNEFIKLIDVEYVSFMSSNEEDRHYWIIVDKPFNNIEEFKKDEFYKDWMVYNDPNYISFTLKRKEFFIRGLFENLKRQPKIIKHSDNLSNDFKNFIKKLEHFYETISLELSTLKYKDANMLNLYKRIKKLERILYE
jgi:hypothetical protein